MHSLRLGYARSARSELLCPPLNGDIASDQSQVGCHCERHLYVTRVSMDVEVACRTNRFRTPPLRMLQRRRGRL